MISSLHLLYGRGDGPPTDSWRELRPERLDPVGVQAYLDEFPVPRRSCFEGVWTAWEPPRPGHDGRPPADLLARAVDSAAAGRVALALSGGLDSALLLSFLERRLPVYTLDIPGYEELDRTARIARRFGVRLEVVRVTHADFEDALPDAVLHAGAPLYNFHIVSKLLFARALRREGFEAAITGDGADQVFAGARGDLYLPFVGAFFRSAGVEIRAPYLDDDVVAAAETDPAKSALRALARGRLPDALIDAPKRPTLYPGQDKEAVKRLTLSILRSLLEEVP